MHGFLLVICLLICLSNAAEIGLIRSWLMARSDGALEDIISKTLSVDEVKKELSRIPAKAIPCLIPLTDVLTREVTSFERAVSSEDDQKKTERLRRAITMIDGATDRTYPVTCRPYAFSIGPMHEKMKAAATLYMCNLVYKDEAYFPHGSDCELAEAHYKR